MMDDQTVKIAGISGSLRRTSFNTATLRALQSLAQDSVKIDIVTLEDVPPFNQDVEERGWPDEVAALRDKVHPAHGIIFAAPEYNYSIPGVLKNAIDWLSRPEREGPLFKKPATIVGATPSMIGTARAQAHLRDIVFYNGMPLLPTAEILIARAGERFDENGNLTDDQTRDFLANMLRDFTDWVRLHRQ